MKRKYAYILKRHIPVLERFPDVFYYPWPTFNDYGSQIHSYSDNNISKSLFVRAKPITMDCAYHCNENSQRSGSYLPL